MVKVELAWVSIRSLFVCLNKDQKKTLQKYWSNTHEEMLSGKAGSW